MTSLIDVTKPATASAYTGDVRQNFQTAAAEISALQDAVAAPATSGQIVLGTGSASITISVGAGVPGGATPGYNQAGSQYTDSQGSPGARLYLSGGDGTWSAIA